MRRVMGPQRFEPSIQRRLRFAELGIEMAPANPESFAKFIKAEADAYARHARLQSVFS